jgi:hypothetical protein
MLLPCWLRSVVEITRNSDTHFSGSIIHHSLLHATTAFAVIAFSPDNCPRAARCHSSVAAP